MMDTDTNPQPLNTKVLDMYDALCRRQREEKAQLSYIQLAHDLFEVDFTPSDLEGYEACERLVAQGHAVRDESCPWPSYRPANPGEREAEVINLGVSPHAP